MALAAPRDRASIPPAPEPEQIEHSRAHQIRL